MAENHNTEMFSQAQDAMQMLQRMERLKKLMGTQGGKTEIATEEKTERGDIFSRNRQENMLSAAIPFLDREFQKEIFVIVRLMEVRRVLQENTLATREKEENPSVRRRKLLGAMQPYLRQEERQQMETILKMMDMKRILGQGAEK